MGAYGIGGDKAKLLFLGICQNKPISITYIIKVPNPLRLIRRIITYINK